jgi:hypothetical protein
VETDDLANFVYSGSDVAKGIGYEMNGDQVIPFPEAGKPDQKSHLAIYFIEFLVKYPYLFRIFEADGMELSYLFRFESIIVLKKANPIGITTKSAP